MSGKGDQKSDRDEMLVGLLATGMPKARAARMVGLSPVTVRRRCADPEFRQRVTDARRELLESTASALAAGAAESVSCLRHLLTCDSDSTRLSAARSLLEMAVRYRDAVSIVDRLQALEDRLGEVDDANSDSLTPAGDVSPIAPRHPHNVATIGTIETEKRTGGGRRWLISGGKVREGSLRSKLRSASRAVIAD